MFQNLFNGTVGNALGNAALNKHYSAFSDNRQTQPTHTHSTQQYTHHSIEYYSRMSNLQVIPVPFNAYEDDLDHDPSIDVNQRILDGTSRGLKRRQAKDRLKCLFQCLPRLDYSSKSNPKSETIMRSTPNLHLHTHTNQLSQTTSKQQNKDYNDEESLIQAYMDSIHFDVQTWTNKGGAGAGAGAGAGVGVEDQGTGTGTGTDLYLANASENDDDFSLCPVESDITNEDSYSYSYVYTPKNKKSSHLAEDGDSNSNSNEWIPFESLSFCTKSGAASKSTSSSYKYCTPPRTPSSNQDLRKINASGRESFLGTPSTEATDQTMNLTTDTDNDIDTDNNADEATEVDKDLDRMLVTLKSVSDLDLPCFESGVSVADYDDDDGNDEFYRLDHDHDNFSAESSISYCSRISNGRPSNIHSHDVDVDIDNDSNLSEGDSISESESGSVTSRINSGRSLPEGDDDRSSSETYPALEQKTVQVGERLASYMSIFYPDECAYGSRDEYECALSDDDGGGCGDDVSQNGDSFVVDEGGTYLQSLEDIGSTNNRFETLYNVNSTCTGSTSSI